LESVLFGLAILAFAHLREGSAPAVTQAILWLPTGIGIACVWRLGHRGAWAVLMAILLQRTLLGYPPSVVIAAAVGSSGEAMLGAWLLRRLGTQGDFTRLRDTIALIATAAVAPIASILASWFTRTTLEVWQDSPFYSGWDGWWRMNALGALTVVPVMLTWLHPSRPPWKLRHGCTLAAMVAGTLGMLWAIMMLLPAEPTTLMALYLVLPWPFVAALRFGMVGATTTSAASAIFVALMAANGIGPFECVAYAERHVALQVYLLTLLAVPLVLASLLAERETSLRALADSEGLRKAMLRVLPDPTFRCNPEGTILDALPTTDSLLPPQEALLGQRLDVLADAATGSQLVASLRSTAAGELTDPVLFRASIGDSVQEARFTRLDRGDVLCLVRDVTEARRAQALLAFEASVLELMAHGKPNAQVFAAVVSGIEELLRAGRASLLRLVGKQLYVAHAPRLPQSYNDALAGMEIGPDRGSCGTAAFSGRTVITADIASDPRWSDFRALAQQHGLAACWSVPVRSAAGSVLGAFAIYYGEPREPTAQELAVVERAATLTGIAMEREQRESLLAAIHDNVVEGIFRSVPGQGLVYANRSLARLFGYEDPAALLQATADAVAASTADTNTPHGRHLADLRRFATAIPRLGPTELCLHRSDGSTFWGLFSCTPVYGADGRKIACDGALADATARRQLEEQLRQAQKMEAIGKLAGGIAHDFNNLLMAIGGYTAAVREQVSADPAAVADLDEIKRAAQRAAGLTRQLLAFSRQQVLAPQLLDLPEVVDGLGNMLRRLIGADIDLQVKHLDGSSFVRIDASQLEQVLLNLTLNARDAMPSGGVLRLQTRRETSAARRAEATPALAPGAYAVLIVQDNGVGMSEEVRARAFDPFFTTKEPGKGTGLGLATVYGIVRQSGGHLELDSAPGQGTTVRIYLPEVAAPVIDTVAHADTPPVQSQVQPKLRILVVEDEPVVRELVLRLLRRAGHNVTGAPDGETALALASSGPAFDLLVTDVVMPGMNGRELAGRLQQLQPRLPVLFMSGYAHDFDGALPEAPGASAFLQKPFDAAALLERVQTLLQTVVTQAGGAQPTT